MTGLPPLDRAVLPPGVRARSVERINGLIYAVLGGDRAAIRNHSAF